MWGGAERGRARESEGESEGGRGQQGSEREKERARGRARESERERERERERDRVLRGREERSGPRRGARPLPPLRALVNDQPAARKGGAEDGGVDPPAVPFDIACRGGVPPIVVAFSRGGVLWVG